MTSRDIDDFIIFFKRNEFSLVIRPRLEISIGCKVVVNPSDSRSFTRFSYRSDFLAFAELMLLSKGTVSSIRVNVFSVLFTSAMSGLRAVARISHGMVEMPDISPGRSL